ncbi:MAG: type II toxin-antitoxin system mRNA interferase toxin, RelE/StbE family [Patescibacteria group bacterium]
MHIYFKKSFIKHYQKLQKFHRTKVDQSLKLFEKNPHNPVLKNHALVGRLAGKRSISARFDMRIIFEVEGHYVTVTMLAVGTHNQVY